MTLILSGTDGLSDIDGSAATPAIRGTDTNTGIFFPAADTIAFSEGGVEAMRLTSAGSLQIGSTSGSAPRLLVYTNDNTDPAILARQDGTAPIQIWQAPGTERARIDNSGNLLVGTTDSASTSGIGNKIRPSASAPDISTVGSASTNSNSTFNLYSTGAGAFRFYVGYGGTVFATSTTISAISDQRLKENICDLDVGLDAVMSLKPRKFDWKEGKGKDIKGDRGWIAQEFEQVFPDLIDEWKDPAPEGEEPYKSVRADLIPVLVKAIQEQQAIIQSLTARIEALEGK